ncbi:ribosome biogenesis GTPase YlqF [Mycoplasmopsis agassizii]|uniref:Ribosome biogenesis GTPase A n=1 Tax=Mycoplasmopsis agassizii TaxID=33922 RepID=A0ABX4H674_9BACT|nr:ribosome biogenesis GTPase YlqF [Mycoplasmopsis agassizii]PAF55352.1 ribosome biogenesis GTPase YlqF [Mycoplasmopsis agassizii]SMC15832.1 ribosome biogenesis GTPase A [Mycoplasmopsis agassizii]
MNDFSDLIVEDQKINWYPGHMAKTLRQLKEKAQLADLFVIVLDARAPISSYNDTFDEIEKNKPRLFLISKKDLGDLNKLEKIKERFASQDNVMLVDLKKENTRNLILKKIEKLLIPKRLQERKKGLLKPRLRVFVVGVPNSGKSTLINLLAKAKKTKVGNMAGITRGQQWVNVGDIQLLDTPGLLWPNLDDQNVAIKLAIIGAIKRDVIPLDLLFNLSYSMASSFYPDKLKAMNLEPAFTSVDIYSQLIKMFERSNLTRKNFENELDKLRLMFYETCRNWTGVTYD